MSDANDDTRAQPPPDELLAVERSLRAERDFNAAILETVASLVVVLDTDGRIVRFNQACERATGYAAGEVLGRSVFDLLIPEPDLPGARAAFAQLRMGDFPNQHRNRWHVKNGGERLIDWSNTALADERGAVQFIIATGTDVTDYERALDARRDSEERFRSVFDSAAVGIGRVSMDGRFLEVNEAYARVVGYTPEELLGVDFRKITHPDDVGADVGHLTELLAGRISSYRMDKRYVRKDGSTVWVSLSVGLARDAGGRPAYCSVVVEDISARKAAEAAVRGNEQRLRAMFEDAAVGIVEVDEGDRIVAANARFCAMLGYACDELVGRTIHEITAPEDAELSRAMNARGHTGERRTFEYEKRYVRRDGSHLWVHVSVSIVPDEAGRFHHAIGTAAEITDRKRAEEEVKAALENAEQERRLLSAVLDALPAGVVITDAKGGFTHVNAEFKRIWGAPPTPRSADEYSAWHGWWPDTGRAIETSEWALARALATGEVIVPGDVVEVEKFDGSGRATIVNAAAPIRSAAGDVIIGGVLAEVDITEQKRAETALRAAEERMRSVIESLPTGLIVADLTTRALHWNRAALAIHGYTGEGEVHKFAESLIAEHELRTLQGEGIPVERWPLPRLLRGETFREYEILVRNTRLGWERVFSYSGVVIDPGGSSPQGLMTIQDVTDRRRAEEAVRAADRRKDEFLGMLSHELRNPLAPIRSSIYLLRRADPGSEQARRAQGIIDRQTEHLTRLVDDLLDVTRITRGKVLLHRGRVDLRELVRRAAEDVRMQLEAKHVALRILLPEARLWADADATRITQVLGNLLANARKFTSAGDEVTIQLREVEATAEITVRDTGAGIEPELLPTLFDAFVQGRRTLARSEGGLGLGLALVKGLVELQGGQVRALSEGQGRGAQFVVTLPLVGPLIDEQAHDVRPKPATAARRVLVVDDNPDAAESLAEMVGLFGHRVDVAFDGPSAIEKVRQHRPEFVLCDIGLPGMTGYEVAKALRAELDGNIRLIAVSGYAQPEDVRRSMEAGFDAHLAKPADPAQIQRMLA